MTPLSLYRPLSLVLVVAICAVILSARLLLSHTHVETAPPSADVASEHHDELPPVW